MEAGIDKMMELAKRERMRARLPLPAEITLALQQLFQSKWRKRSGLTDTEAQLALQSLRYVFEPETCAVLLQAFVAATGFERVVRATGARIVRAGSQATKVTQPVASAAELRSDARPKKPKIMSIQNNPQRP